jgi:ribosome maturation protein SDO1
MKGSIRKDFENYGKTVGEHTHLAKLKKGGEQFEVIIDADKALKFRNGEDVDLSEVLKADKIFSDAKKGMSASEHVLQTVFRTTDADKIAEIILKEGEIELTQAYREGLAEQKKKRIIEIIHQNCINAKTETPIPVSIIEDALKEAKVKIDHLKAAEDQVKNVVKALQAILPMRMEMREIEVKLDANHAAKTYPYVKRISTVVKDTWNNDGSLTCVIQLPAGMFDEFLDKMNSYTHGEVEIKIMKK